MASRLFVLLLCLLMAACAKAPPLADLPLSKQDDTLVRTDAGAYVGGISENKARTWLGIPYAKPPIGDLRWRATEPLPYQDSTRTALQHANWCPQLTNGLDGLFGTPKGELRGNEDCLYLDIYAPSDATSRSNLPVMFWIHGGSNVWGRAAQYDGSALAQSENVIVVVVQYRLGPLGWFAHPALEDGIANFALLDLVQALKWTRQNIRNFGGDPDAVTLFGESAGANNVLALLAMPEADGLYRAAIAQSGLPMSVPLELSTDGMAASITGAVPAAQAFSGLSEPDSVALRQAPLERIFDAYRTGRTPVVIRDGVTLPDEPLTDAIASHQSGANLPVIIGSNRDEAKYLLAFDPQMINKTFFVFPTPRDSDHYSAVSHYMTGLWRTLGVSEFTGQLLDADTGPVRTYRFDWDEEARVGPSDLSEMIGAAHSLEIPFVFGNFENFMGKLDKRLFTKTNATGRQALSQTMMSCWAQFAHGRDPGSVAGEPCPHWPEITTDAPTQTMIFDTPEDGGSRAEIETETTRTLIAQLATDPVLNDGRRRCELTNRLSRTFFLLRPELTDELSLLCTQ